MGKERITVTIDEVLVRDLDRAAEARNQNRSNVVEAAIRTWKRVQLEQDLINGYRSMAEEDVKVAEADLAAGYEALE